ncbi:YceD family protein [Microbacterium sp. HM-570]
MREHDFEVSLAERWGEGLVHLDQGGTVDVDVRLESVHEGIMASGEAHGEYVGICGRCLIDIAAPLEVEFQELFAYPGQETSDFEVQDDHVDLETLVRDAVILSLPFQPVCQPDCPGLDPVTGERLADMDSNSLSSDLDPRWSALRQLAQDDASASAREPDQNP